MTVSRELEVMLRIQCAPNLIMDQTMRFGLIKLIRNIYSNLLKQDELLIERDPCNAQFRIIQFSFVSVDPKVDLDKMVESCITLIEANTGKKVETVGLNPIIVSDPSPKTPSKP